MDIIGNNKRVALIIATLWALLLIPLVAMHLSDEVNWNPADFLIAAFLLAGTGLLLEIILRKTKKKHQRLFFGVILFVFLILVWAELAVGIFDSPLSGS